MVCVARIRLGSWESARAFKGVIYDDISEFESYMPSQAVGSLWELRNFPQRRPAIGTDMREHVLVFCLLGLVLIAAIILVIAPAAVTWTLAVIE
jgi:hypothetical protein